MQDQITWEVEDFEFLKTEACGEPGYSFHKDGTLVCGPQYGAWKGKVTWDKEKKHYYIDFSGASSNRPRIRIFFDREKLTNMVKYRREEYLTLKYKLKKMEDMIKEHSSGG